MTYDQNAPLLLSTEYSGHPNKKFEQVKAYGKSALKSNCYVRPNLS